MTASALALAQPNPDASQSIGDLIRDNLQKLRKWLPENTVVQRALKQLSSGQEELKPEEYENIIKGLLDHTKELEKEAFTDPRKGYLNKNAFYAALKETVKKGMSAQEDQPPVTVVVLDLNYLKQLNGISMETGGDAAIDYLCKHVTEKLRKPSQKLHPNNPEGDMFARLGGDEFAIIMKDCNVKAAKDKIQPILEEMARESITPPTAEEQAKRIDKRCWATNDKGVKAPVQVSAAFGCAELDMNLAKSLGSGDEDHNIRQVISKTLKEAGDAEAANKTESKLYADNIKNINSKKIGTPFADDREEAEKIVKKHLAEKFIDADKKEHIALAGAAQKKLPAMMSARQR